MRIRKNERAAVIYSKDERNLLLCYFLLLECPKFMPISSRIRPTTALHRGRSEINLGEAGVIVRVLASAFQISAPTRPTRPHVVYRERRYKRAIKSVQQGHLCWH